MALSNRSRDVLQHQVEGMFLQGGVLLRLNVARRFARQVQKDLKRLPVGPASVEAYGQRLHALNCYVKDIYSNRANLRGRFVRRHKNTRLCDHKLTRLRTFRFKKVP